MITQQLLKHGQGLAARFGAGKVLIVCGLGCLLPIACTGFLWCGFLLLLVEWR